MVHVPNKQQPKFPFYYSPDSRPWAHMQNNDLRTDSEYPMDRKRMTGACTADNRRMLRETQGSDQAPSSRRDGVGKHPLLASIDVYCAKAETLGKRYWSDVWHSAISRASEAISRASAITREGWVLLND